MQLSKTMVEALTCDYPCKFRRVRTLRALKTRKLVRRISTQDKNGLYAFSFTPKGLRVRKELKKLRLIEEIFS